MLKSDTGNTVSCWMPEVKMPATKPLENDITCDVCIVGAGLAGITTAYLLQKEGKKVVVLDKGPIGGGETGRTTAHLSDALDDRYEKIIQVHGVKGAMLAAESHAAAIDKIEEIVKQENIDCDFQRTKGYLFLLPSDKEEELDKELEATHKIGYTEVIKLQHNPIQTLSKGPVLCFPDQGQFHPMKYLAALAQIILDNGGHIFTDSQAHSFESGLVARVQTLNKHTVTANNLVVCTNTPVNDWVTMHTKQAAYRTYVLAYNVPHNSVPEGLYWDNSDPYHYIRTMRGKASEGKVEKDLLIVGGEDHKTGQEENPEERFNCLDAWARQHFNIIESEAYRWSGQVMEPVDYLAFIGRNPGDSENVYIATGDSGHGMTHATIAGMLITDLIMKRDNPWETLYDPGRISLNVTTAGEFMKENLNVAQQYTDWVTPGDAPTADSLLPETGCVIRKGMQKVAVYCDKDGNHHEHSAVCPHLGCIVHWNNVEKSWDCPCHGSRFDALGKVMNGPALSDLGPAEK
ncbi:FAD-dependent oxidoreductase [Adhaeribacter sp. BT258]|uniref:FAD-dependent oxidoreductase n=1 Tax=Adhaeribacter terrigena TaxID=2793070 RepID=A0ABS1C5N4_9BACT|nr:FAD-dependent oxidoreductase [Adhaeribacter terrigena]MBK0404698.1 FAD-dependent oxidoreductase [Adhaeribacter terrigena]